MSDVAKAFDRFKLDGRVALVTGSSRGIGRAIAEALAMAGASVVVNGRGAESAKSAEDAIRAQGGQALAVAADVSDSTAVNAMFSQVMATFGRIDILVNNVGVSTFYKRAEDITEADWDLVMSTNLKSVFLCAQAAGRLMKEQGSGSIINVASIGGLVALPRLAAYCTAKGGIVQLTKVLAVEWAADGIRVNTLAPGWVETDMTRSLFEHPRFGPPLRDNAPMSRTGQTEEIVGAVLYLASDAASFTTGQALVVDGGWTAW